MADSKNIQQEPCELLPGYEWTTCNLSSQETCKTCNLSSQETCKSSQHAHNCEEVCQFLNVHYAGVKGESIEANFSMEFLRWALCPPDYHESWHVGVRDTRSKELIAFIGGVPVLMRVMGSDVRTAMINFLCVHKDHRSIRLVPKMIAEMTRQVQLKGVGQAVYAVTDWDLHTPGVPICSYISRMRKLNPKTLVDVRLPDVPVTPRLKNMKRSDISGVKDLLNDINSDKKIGVSWNDNTIEHLLLPKEDVIHSYVVRDPRTSDITDFCSFFTIPFTAVANGEKTSLNCAYSFYICAKATKLTQLMNDALMVAEQKGVDMFYALDMGEDENFWKELKFVEDDEYIYYIHGANGIENPPLTPSEIGIVLW